MRSKRLREALSLLLQAREHVDRYGSLDSEGRTLLSKAVKLLKREGLVVNWRNLRKNWDVEEVDKLVAKVLNLIECLERSSSHWSEEGEACEREFYSD